MTTRPIASAAATIARMDSAALTAWSAC
uniref:Uncharacterized protein n=1 Tax=Arundo donax TaxID=35708 RepID=A0A0A8YCC8_ARUDO